MRLIFFVEGFTDIRFVSGLAQVCDLTMVVPARSYRESGLESRVSEAKVPIRVEKIGGGRIAFQLRSFLWLWKHAREFDGILAQEMLRGALNSTVIGKLRGVPVATYLGIAPVDYFRCRRERKQIGFFKALVGEWVIRLLLKINGRLSDICLGMGPYLREVGAKYCSRTAVGLYYGVDTHLFRPATAQEIRELRQRLRLPTDKFLVVLSSRISHEKDPETVLKACSLARNRGVDLVLLNLGGGFRDFLALAKKMGIANDDQWVLGRAAVNPLRDLADYFRAADALALASLAEGAAFSTLEALACGTPVVATDIGGMHVQLQGYASLVPRQDFQQMAKAIECVAKQPKPARDQAMRGREYVVREWNHQKAFSDLIHTMISISNLPKEETLPTAHKQSRQG